MVSNQLHSFKDTSKNTNMQWAFDFQSKAALSFCELNMLSSSFRFQFEIGLIDCSKFSSHFG